MEADDLLIFVANVLAPVKLFKPAIYIASMKGLILEYLWSEMWTCWQPFTLDLINLYMNDHYELV